MPSALRRQLPEDAQSAFVLNKGLDNCLVLFPEQVWDAELQRIQSLNMYEGKNRAFARMFLSAAAPVTVDGSDRILIPKHLIEKVGLKKDIILLAQIDRIEIWDLATYEAWISDPGFDMADLAEDVMKDMK